MEYFMKIIDKDDIRIQLIEDRGETVEEEVVQIHKERIETFISDAKMKAKGRLRDLDLEVRPNEINRLRQLAQSKNQLISFSRN